MIGVEGSYEFAEELLPASQLEALKEYGLVMRDSLLRMLLKVPGANYDDGFIIVIEELSVLFPDVEKINIKFDYIVSGLIESGIQ
jgi:hypothetical protein